MYIGDFNARNSEWWGDDSTKIAELTAQYNLNQIIDVSTHILSDSVSCIDLIFTKETKKSCRSCTEQRAITSPWYVLSIMKVR